MTKRLDMIRQQLMPDPKRPDDAEGNDESGGLESFFLLPVGDYVARSRPANKPVFSLHAIPHRVDEIRVCQYLQLESYHSRFVSQYDDGTHKGNAFYLRFGRAELLVVGRRLLHLFDLICQHRISWIYELADPVKAAALPDETTVITRLAWQTGDVLED